MKARTFWALDDDDAPVVDRLAAGLGRNPARILAYLLLRAERESDPARNVDLQVGTRLSRSTLDDAITRLESADLIERTSVQDVDRGRPPAAWRPVGDFEETRRRAYHRHGGALLDRAVDQHTDGRIEIDGRRESNGRKGPAGRNESTGAPGDRLQLALNWRPNGLHVPIYAAAAAGWYDEFDVDVRVEHHDGSRRALDRVSSGAADVAVVGAATIVRAREASEPVVPIAALYQRAMTVLYTAREVFGEPLRSVEQLRGRRVGMPQNSETRLLGRLFLAKATNGDVEIVATDGEEANLLLDGGADVVTGSFTDPRQLGKQELTIDALLVTDHFPIYGPMLVVHRSALTERPTALRNFLAGTTAGWAAGLHDPHPAAEQIAAEDDDDEALFRRTFEQAAVEFGESDAVRERGWGWQRPETWASLRTALEQAELLRESR